MSRETATWLNNNTLIGYTDKRGTAWHYRADKQGAEPNHYPAAIPVEDVRRRLFAWEPLAMPLEVTLLDENGVSRIVDETRKVIVRPDTRTVLGVFRDSYQPHGYDQWLVKNVESILDADLAIGSAGLLKGGAVAWVQVEMSDTLNAGGVEFRPFLTAATSLDGSLATTYLGGAQVVVCDNTLSAALGSFDKRIKVKHSKRSLGRLSDVREALGIVQEIGDDFTTSVNALLDQAVTDAQWAAFVDEWSGMSKATAAESKKGVTVATAKSEQLNSMYFYDERVAPWQGTAWGVVSAVNTWTHHEQRVRGADRATRNAERMVTGRVDALDAATIELLAAVSH